MMRMGVLGVPKIVVEAAWIIGRSQTLLDGQSYSTITTSTPKRIYKYQHPGILGPLVHNVMSFASISTITYWVDQVHCATNPENSDLVTGHPSAMPMFRRLGIKKWLRHPDTT
jgi:hypothetical protein